MFYEKLPGNKIQCGICPRRCVVAEGNRGHCGVRENRKGEYYSLVWGRVVALNNDPIEKKPFNHVLPGTMVLSAATVGCNIHCKFCQNWQISQARPEETPARRLTPEDLVGLAIDNHIPSVALTYSEPTIYYKYMYETARLAKANGLNCVVVSNGFINEKPLLKLLPHLTAYKVDLKAFTDDYYRQYCDGRLAPVLETLKTIRAQGVWLEIVNLILPTANDGVADIRAMARWIHSNLGEATPIHFSRFHPMYRMRDLPPTPVATLERCRKAAMEEGLPYAYLGNVPGHPGENTYCRGCGRPVIERTGLWSVENYLKEGVCPTCGERIPGIWV